jgi:hypothetical protein
MKWRLGPDRGEFTKGPFRKREGYDAHIVGMLGERIEARELAVLVAALN